MRRIWQLLVVVLTILFAIPQVTFSQGGNASNQAVWFWFGDCSDVQTMGLDVMLDGESIYHTDFRPCQMDRNDAKSADSKRKRSFTISGGHTFQGEYQTKKDDTIKGNIWQAGADPDALLLGLSFVTKDRILLNTIHIAKPGETTQTKIDSDMVVKTYPLSPAAPPNIYVDKGACPFECCTYREWVALTDVTLLDSPNGKKVVGRIKKGEKVLALTGEVHSVPVRVTAQYDYPEAGVKAGDTIYILHSEGEGYCKVWHDGKVVDLECPSDGSEKKVTWWVKLRTRSGIIGWTVEHSNFGNQDACG